MATASESFRLFDLPLELTREIYGHLIADFSTYVFDNGSIWCPPESEDRYDFCHCRFGEYGEKTFHEPRHQPTILQLNKKISAELLEMFYRRGVFTHKISADEAGLDAMTVACFKHMGKTVNYETIPHLIVEVSPPTSDFIEELICILKHLRSLCVSLKAATQLQKVTFRFLDNGSLTWNNYWGRPMVSIPSNSALIKSDDDIQRCLVCLSALSNVAEAVIEMPPSYCPEKELIHYHTDVELSMMNKQPLEDCVESAWKEVEDAISWAGMTEYND